MSEALEKATSNDLPDLPPEPEEKGTYELQKLRAHHEEIIRLYVATPGKVTYKEIAEAVGCTEQMVCYTLNSEIAKEKIRTLQEGADDAAMDTMEKLHELAGYSVQKLEKILLSPSTPQKLRARVAQDILDRTGNKKPTRHEHAHGHFSKEDIEEMKQRAKKTGNVEEASAEVVAEEETESGR